MRTIRLISLIPVGVIFLHKIFTMYPPSTILQNIEDCKYRFDYFKRFVMEDTPSEITICNEASDIFEISDIVLLPDPPLKGQNLSIRVRGDMKNELTEGSYMTVMLKIGALEFPIIQLDTCEYLENKCPINKGEVDLEMKFAIPNELPSGTVNAEVLIYNGNSLISEDVYNFTSGVSVRIMKLMKGILSHPRRLFVKGSRVACVKGILNI